MMARRKRANGGRAIRQLIALLFFCFGVSVWATSRGSTTDAVQVNDSGTSRVIEIGRLKNPDRNHGCGCTFYFPGEERWKSVSYVISSDDEQKLVWMNIDGQDVELKLVRSIGPRRERVGSRSIRTYTAAGLSVTANLKATWVCPRRDDSCEVTRYRGIATVTRGKRSRTIKLTGDCGC